ncbi:MAG: bifunctional oligoribonuclease/PAP phosphatase NrnA [Andreesenia angusta]|nr:bifunctional oligoribonuclease/PAP phosphatase NrnA [Andreesenia angusta]
MKKIINNLEKKLSESKNILVISHISPDGDSIGSILGLGFGLRKKYGNKKIDIAIKDEVPKRFSFLKTENIGEIKSSDDYDLVFVLDCGDLHRAGISIEKSKIINIDHHITNPKYGTINIVKSEASSTSEIVFNILKAMDISIDEDIAESLYTGILTDTGSFRYSSTSSNSHRVVAELIDIGINRDKIVNAIYQNNSLAYIRLLKEAIDNMELFFDDRIAYLLVDKDIIEKSKSDMKYSDILVEFLRDIEGVEISIVLKKLDNGLKGSLRAKSIADVSGIASKFDGGGHIRASGFFSTMPIDELKKELISNAEEELKKYFNKD